MELVAGNTAFITGGAGGFGLTMARRLASSGMAIMLADFDPAALDNAVAALRGDGADVDGVVCDVSERSSMMAAAARTSERFGQVHLLCNNAGVALAGSMVSLSAADWEWIWAVNVMGVVNGVAAFLPTMLDYGQPAHIVNMASIAGLRGMPLSGAYCASKSAVIALSEALRAELEGTTVGVTVLCPSFMKTGFFSSGDKRQARFGGPGDIWMTDDQNVKDHLVGLLEAGHTPDFVAAAAIAAIRNNDPIVTTNSADRPMIAERFEEVMASFDRAGR